MGRAEYAVVAFWGSHSTKQVRNWIAALTPTGGNHGRSSR